jgi:hypothetical protein
VSAGDDGNDDAADNCDDHDVFDTMFVTILCDLGCPYTRLPCVVLWKLREVISDLLPQRWSGSYSYGSVQGTFVLCCCPSVYC